MKKDEEFTMQDAFIREVDEDLKNESLKKLWDKYGLFVIIFVVAALTLAVSYETLKAWFIRRAENWSDAYAVALSLQNQEKYPESLDALNMIIDKKFGAFADLAQLQQVNVLLGSGQQTEALTRLRQIIDDKKLSPQLRDVAIIKLASYQQDSAPLTEIAALLRPITDNPQNAWYAMAKEMLATAMLRDGNIDQAREIYQNLLSNNDIPDDFKTHIKNILSVLGNK